MFVDNYLGGLGAYQGGIVEELASGFGGQRHWDAGMRRPYFDKHGRRAVTVNTGRTTLDRGVQVPIREHKLIRDLVNNEGIVSPVFNNTALRKEEWIELDRTVLRAARYRLRLWADLMANNPYGGFNGMGKIMLEHETMADPGEAMVDMDAMTEGRSDMPLFQLEGLPLPITHADFFVSNRKLTISRNTGTPIDTTMGEACARRVAEKIEKTAIGVSTGITYGGASTYVGGYGRTSQVYGLTNFSARLTKTNLTAPTAGGWTPEQTQIDFNSCLNQLRNNKFYGPYMVYHSGDWEQYLDGDYYVAKTSGAVAPTKSLRNRLREIDMIQDIKRLDFLFPNVISGNPTDQAVSSARGPGTDVDVALKPFTMIFVQMTPDVIQAVNGMDITTVQWESIGGMRLNFKVMAIQVPRIRADYYGNCGILHATTS